MLTSLMSNFSVEWLLQVAGILFLLGLTSWCLSELIFIGIRLINRRRGKRGQ